MSRRRFIMRVSVVLALLLPMAASGLAGGNERDDLTPKDLARVTAVTRPATDFTAAEPFEGRPGGAATTDRTRDANVLSHPSANLSFSDQQRFLVGNGLFRKDWVSAPSSTLASDGLGPLFNARACQACHIKDGRGHAPAVAGGEAVSMLVRLSVEPDAEQKKAIEAGRIAVVPHPAFGSQLQDNAVAGLEPEGRPRIDYSDEPVTLAGGEVVRLRRPRLTIVTKAGDAIGNDVMRSARIASPMTGMGLLQAIPEADILAHADPEDRDGDGISGRPNLVGDGRGGVTLGRFGWKAVQPTVELQTAHAFSGDMGLSTPVLDDRWGDCTRDQASCRSMPTGVQATMGREEVPRDLLDLVIFYAEHLAPPMRRSVDDREVLAGKQAFYQAGCASCHVPKFVTSRRAPHPALRFQLVWPYSDLLLHDMGEGLADDRPEGLADGREWRTPPLWGIGVARRVSEQAGYLHDGRARDLKEAILWHGGEAAPARDRFAVMDAVERDALLAFLGSL